VSHRRKAEEYHINYCEYEQDVCSNTLPKWAFSATRSCTGCQQNKSAHWYQPFHCMAPSLLCCKQVLSSCHHRLVQSLLIISPPPPPHTHRWVRPRGGDPACWCCLL
jgi:hypothetical protein